MPGYAGTGEAPLLRVNRQIYLLQNETIFNRPEATMAVQLERLRDKYNYPFGASFELQFSGDPGAFEVDIQTADYDADSHYCTINAWTSSTQLNSSFVGRIELPQFWAKYVRGYVKTLTNAVTVTLLLTR